MAVSKLSQIAQAGSPPALTDFAVGVSATAVDELVTWTQVGQTVGSPQPTNANINFFVATTGSDSNNGTSSLTPFATIQHALNAGTAFNYQGQFFCTISVADGTYDLGTGSPLSIPALVNAPAGFRMTGNTTTPSNVVLFDSAGNGGVQMGGVAARASLFSGFEIDSPLFIFNVSATGASLVPGNVSWTDRTNNGPNFLNISGPTNVFSLRGTLSCLTNLFDVFANLGGGAGVTFRFSTINFQASTSMNVFVFGNSAAIYSEQGNTYTNLGTMTGKQLGITTGVILATNDGTLTNIGGNTVGAFDDTCAITQFGFGGTIIGIFGESNAGVPTTTQLPVSQTWGVFKDTSGGGVYVAFNDGGTIKKVALT